LKSRIRAFGRAKGTQELAGEIGFGEGYKI
jgi:hypothetical protein